MRTRYDHVNIEAVGHKLQVNNLSLKPIEFDGLKKSGQAEHNHSWLPLLKAGQDGGNV